MQMFFDGHYPTLPKYWIYPEAQPRHIPNYSAVYIIVDWFGTVQYVGQTTNMRQRYGDHQKWMKPKDRIGWIACPGEELLFMESWFIATLRPWMNANQNKRSAKAVAKKSAKLDVIASRVWKRGRVAEVNDSTSCRKLRWTGRIEDLKDSRVCVNGEWRPKNRVTVALA